MERTEVELPFLRKQSCSVPFVRRWPQGTRNSGGKKAKKKAAIHILRHETLNCNFLTTPAMLIASP